MWGVGVYISLVLLSNFWCALGERSTLCDPTVFGGMSFSQFVTEKRCDVDEKILKLFMDDDSFESMVNKTAANVMCIGFIAVFNMASEDSCSWDSLAHIPSEDFCKDNKILDVLILANNSGVFDGHSKVTEVANFIFKYCDYMCNDTTGSNELCWAFGEYVKIVKKLHVTTTPPPPTPDFMAMFSSDNVQHESPKVSEDGNNLDIKNDDGVADIIIDNSNWGETDTIGVEVHDSGENKGVNNQEIVSKGDMSDVASATVLDDRTLSDGTPSSFSNNPTPPLDGEDQAVPSSSQKLDHPTEELATDLYPPISSSTQSGPYDDKPQDTLYYDGDSEETGIVHDEASVGPLYNESVLGEDSVRLAILSLIVFAAALAYVVANGRPVTVVNEDYETV